jgi:hypothetical protein
LSFRGAGAAREPGIPRHKLKLFLDSGFALTRAPE